jgi:hypothetical protein
MMNRVYTVLAGLAGITALLFLVAIAAHPVLYLPPGLSSTEFHKDPGTRITLPASTGDDIRGLMGDIMDTTGAITVSVKVKDIGTATRDLEKLEEVTRQFESVVVKLDLSESDLGSFQRLNRENIRTLAGIINDTGRFEQLKKLEVTYRDNEDPAIMTTLSYEGTSLSSRIRNAYEQYEGREPDITRIGQEMGVPTSPYREGTGNLQEFAQETEGMSRGWNEERERVSGTRTEALVKGDTGFTFSVVPDSGGYGDTLLFKGGIRGGVITDKEVRVFLDGSPVSSARTDGSGIFSSAFRIEHISQGNHTAYAQEASSYSPVVTLTIRDGPGRLTLSCERRGESGAACRGDLSSASTPVRSAPVTVLVDSVPVTTAVTGDNGGYEAFLNLPPGTHSLTATFDASGFPLRPATSSPVSLSIPGSAATGTGAGAEQPSYPVQAAIFLVFCAVATLLILRLGKNRSGVRESPPGSEEGPVDRLRVFQETSSPPGGGEQDPGQLVSEFLSSAPEQVGTVAYKLFRRLRELAGDAGTPVPGGITARELAGIFSDSPAGPFINEFVRKYERVRYAGRIPAEGERRDMAEAFSETFHRFKGGPG